MRPPGALAAVAAALVAACSWGGDGDGGPGRARPPRTATAPATTATTWEDIDLAGPQPATVACPAVPAMAAPSADRPRYRLDLDVHPAEGVVDGHLAVDFGPDVATDRLVFRLWPNGPRPRGAGGGLEAGPVTVDGLPTAAERPDPTTLVVPLGRTLGPGERVEAAMGFRLTVPGPSSDRIASQDGAIRLGSFFPVLAWEPGAGWASDPPTAGFAEASVAPVADFDLTVAVPEGLTALASGVPDGPGRWRAEAQRDVAVSIGRFRLAEGVAAAPGPVRVVVGVHEGAGDAPEPYRDRTVAVLEDFARRFGPYPYATHTLAVTPGLRGGIEYPTHVMQGPGTLGRVTSHEVGHMWFYSLVGNHQGRDPWLDEGLATYAEARAEGTEAAVASAPLAADVLGQVGRPMTYWDERPTDYYEGVYLQGAQALLALGAPDRVDCALRHYAAVEAFDVARPGDLVASLRRVFPDAPAVMARFGVR